MRLIMAKTPSDVTSSNSPAQPAAGPPAAAPPALDDVKNSSPDSNSITPSATPKPAPGGDAEKKLKREKMEEEALEIKREMREIERKKIADAEAQKKIDAEKQVIQDNEKAAERNEKKRDDQNDKNKISNSQDLGDLIKNATFINRQEGVGIKPKSTARVEVTNNPVHKHHDQTVNVGVNDNGKKLGKDAETIGVNLQDQIKGLKQAYENEHQTPNKGMDPITNKPTQSVENGPVIPQYGGEQEMPDRDQYEKNHSQKSAVNNKEVNNSTPDMRVNPMSSKPK